VSLFLPHFTKRISNFICIFTNNQLIGFSEFLQHSVSVLRGKGLKDCLISYVSLGNIILVGNMLPVSRPALYNVGTLVMVHIFVTSGFGNVLTFHCSNYIWFL